MISILADCRRSVTPPSNALIAHSVADYIDVRQRIRQALDQERNLTVYITNTILLRWLDDLQRYPRGVVEWRELNPLDAFARHFRVEAGPPFTPELIIALDLDNLRPIPEGMSIEPVRWILGERLTDLWRYEEPPNGHAAQLAAWAAKQHAGSDPTLHPLIDTQLARWAERAPIYRALHALTLSKDGSALLLRSALRCYDAAWCKTQPWGHLPLLDADVEATACIEVLENQRATIELYWRQRFAAVNQSAKFIPIALDQMSGLSSAELNALEMLLDRQPSQITETLVAQIQQRFSQLPGVAEKLRALRARVAPPLPSIPISDWTSVQWLRWATKMYMPYFAWTVRYEQDRQHQQTCARLFSDWLYAHYPAWLNDDRSPLLLAQYQLLRDLLDSDPHAIVVWLVVDGLTWWQGALLRDACEARGFHAQRHTAGIAVLPSLTSVSKRALVTGVPTPQNSQSSIAEAARDKLRLLGINGYVSYRLADALQIAQKSDGTRCTIVLFNMLDVLAHRTSSFTDDAGIRGYLDDLASGLQQLRIIYEAQGRTMHALIGSDHGSTLLPADAHILRLPDTSGLIDDQWEPETVQHETQKPSTRAATVSNPDRLNVEERAAWYVLDRDQFQLDRHYLVPRGYSYVGRRPSGWVHGGLTPEEVIVPLLHFTAKQVEHTPLTVELIGQLEAHRATTIMVVIINPNRFPVDALILDIGYGAAPVQAEHLGPLGRHQTTIEFPGVTGSAADVFVQWQIRYDTVSGTKTQQGQQTLAVRRLQTDDSGFDDFFADS